MQGSYTDGKEKFTQRPKDSQKSSMHKQDKKWRDERRNRRDNA